MRKSEDGNLHQATLEEVFLLSGGEGHQVEVELTYAPLWNGYYLVGKLPDGRYIFSKDLTEKEV